MAINNSLLFCNINACYNLHYILSAHKTAATLFRIKFFTSKSIILASLQPRVIQRKQNKLYSNARLTFLGKMDCSGQKALLDSCPNILSSLFLDIFCLLYNSLIVIKYYNYRTLACAWKCSLCKAQWNLSTC